MSNKFVSFLKKAGQILATGAEVAIETLPILQPFTALLPQKIQGAVGTVESTVGTDATWLLQAVVSAETAGGVLTNPGLSGAQKAAMAGTYLAPAFTAAMSIAGKAPKDPAAANAALITIAGGVADFMNAYDGSALPTAGSAVVVPTPTV